MAASNRGRFRLFGARSVGQPEYMRSRTRHGYAAHFVQYLATCPVPIHRATLRSLAFMLHVQLVEDFAEVTRVPY